MIIEFLKLIIFSMLIVLISKYILAKSLRKLTNILDLKTKTTGNLAGIATSIPEFLTTTISAIKGLTETSIMNIFSSNVINMILFIISVLINKNFKELKNKIIIIEFLGVLITIFIPILFIIKKINFDLSYVVLFITLYIIFKLIESFLYKTFYIKLKKESKEKEEKKDFFNRTNYLKVINISKNIIFILIGGFLLFLVGQKLSESLEILANSFNISQIIIGIVLGFVTSMPEFITFFEAQKNHKNKEDGVLEAFNNLLTSNMINLFIIQSSSIILKLFLSNS